jgi:hypothetical protein
LLEGLRHRILLSGVAVVTLYSNPGICPDWLFCCT